MEFKELVKEQVEMLNTLDRMDKKLDEYLKRKHLSYRIYRFITHLFN